jgi:hypothetical protein
MSDTATTEAERLVHPPIPIIIDRRPYEAPRNPMAGEELRQLADPPIGPDRDFYLDRPGTRGILIHDDERVDLEPGMRFFSVPKDIHEG